MSVTAIESHPRFQRVRRLLSKKEIALALGRSPRWVEIQMRDCGLPFTRDAHTGYCRFDLAEVEDWKAKREES